MSMFSDMDYRAKTQQNPEDVEQMAKEIEQILQKYNHLGFVTLIRTFEAAAFEAVKNSKIK